VAGAQKVAGNLETVVASTKKDGQFTTESQGVVDESFNQVPERDVVCQMILQSVMCLEQSNKPEAAREMRVYVGPKCPDANPMPSALPSSTLITSPSEAGPSPTAAATSSKPT
jgi:hypothetical protein